MNPKASEPLVSVRVVSADYYMSSPFPGLDIGYSTYRGQEIKKVPVIRIFGSTSTGYKVCLHVHGVFPYFYIPYDGSVPPERMGHQIVMALDKAINILQGQGMSSTHHVFKAVLVSGVPIYGYHAKEHQFFKVYFYNPITRKHSYDLLLNGAVLKKILQPCEAHIPFILQFFMDFNLQGMNFIHLKNAFARRQPNDVNIESSKANPVSTCEMELDCFAGDILNSLDVQDGVQMNPGLAALWEEEIERRKIKNMNLDNINPPPSQPRPKAEPSSSHTFYLNNMRKRIRDCAREMGDVSMSFCEVNEQLETSLAIETPDEAENKLLSASSIDLHVPGERKHLLSTEEDELLDILCELADEHESFVGTPSTTSVTDTEDRAAGSQNSISGMTVTTPLLDVVSSCETVEDLPFDEDSILGTQCSKASQDRVAPIGSSDPTSDASDEERETLEMSQIFDDSEHVLDTLEYSRKTGNRFGPSTSLVQITEQDEDDSHDSSYSESYLPNLDGANDDSSDDEPHASDSGATKKARKYKPLLFRPSSRNVRKANLEARTTLQLTSPASTPRPFRDEPGASSICQKTMPRLSDSFMNDTRLERSETNIVPCQPSSATNDMKTKSELKPNNDEYDDALFAMSYLSPLLAAAPESPPRPGTPLKDARIVVNPLLRDISVHENISGRKITIRSARVLLKSLDEEIVHYQSQTRLKLRLPSSLSSLEKSVKQRSGKRQRKKKSANNEEKKKKSDQGSTSFVSGGTEKDINALVDEEKRADCSSGRETFVAEEEMTGNVSEIRSEDSKKDSGNIEINNESCETGGQPMEVVHQEFHINNQNQVIVKEVEKVKEDNFSIEEKGTIDLIKQNENNFASSIEEIEAKSDSNKEIINDQSLDNRIELPNSSPAPVEVTDLQQCNDGNTSERGSSSESFPSWLGSSHSVSQNPSRSSSTLHFLRSDSSNSVWNDESSLLSEDRINVEEKSLSNLPNYQSLTLPPQVFHPSSVYTNLVDGPTRQNIISTMELYNIPSADNSAPFWGDPKDLPSGVKSKDYGRISVPIGSNLVRHLPDFGSIHQQIGDETFNEASSPIVLTTLIDPPSRQSVVKWLEEKKESQTASSDPTRSPRKGSEKPAKAKNRKEAGDRSQLEAPSLNNSFGFRASFGNCLEAKAVHQNQYLTILSLEIHVETRQNLQPDPEFDTVMALFYSITNDVPLESQIPEIVTGVIVVNQETGEKCQFFNRAGIVDVKVLSVDSEVALFQQFALLVSTWNPDILVGYEIEMVSLGYLLQRSTILGIPLHNLLSRIPENVPDRPVANTEDVIEGGYMVEKNSDINIPGRIVLNLWRILRVEIALQSYTFENMLFHILHRRVSTFTFEKLTSWWKSNHDRWQVVEHYITRVRGNVELMEQLDVIGRTSELARLFGIQFYEVFTRGSQFRVESMMLRLAKPKNFVAVSPSVTQRSRMKAPEWLPLILEPESKFYTDPVLVLDFQSLYPSMIIAYNYCYSTCLGRTHLVGKNEPFEFGCTQLLIPPAVAQQLVKQNLVNISPAGVVFVKPEVRRGIMPQMLSEILNTRIMVKQSMKEYEGDNTLRRVFDSRQLGLKLIANVTYGYTSANFSGRMPCVELGDSVVSKGRETLERAIHLIEERTEWKARVVYGDTDSVFVLLPGRSRQEAFEIGDQIANAVTEINPQPVKLKFEKVYQPCILQTKKRYVGYKYESVKQKEPVYEAKGIETVRRDGCPAVVKLLERSLRVLFESYDVSKVKAYVERQFSKILQNRNSLQDFIFAKEFRGRQGYKPGACVPALEIAKQQVRIDRRSEPRIGERVPYIVTYGSPGVPLIRLVVPANQLLVDTSLRLNGHYYITRAIIPALQRCLGLLGVDVLSWYQNLPRVAAAPTSVVGPIEHGNSRKATISQYFGSSLCLLCDEPISVNGLCATCGANRQASSFSLAVMQRFREKDYAELISLCRSCTGSIRVEQDCVSMDCPVLYRRVKAFQNLQLVSKWYDALSML